MWTLDETTGKQNRRYVNINLHDEKNNGFDLGLV
jgi:hypothetical protein